VGSKAEYSALSSTRSQKKKLKQTTPVPFHIVQVKNREVSPEYAYDMAFTSYIQVCSSIAHMGVYQRLPKTWSGPLMAWTL